MPAAKRAWNTHAPPARRTKQQKSRWPQFRSAESDLNTRQSRASVVRDALIIGPSIHRCGRISRASTRPDITMRPPVHVHLRGKTVLLTGGTGFLGKVIVE